MVRLGCVVVVEVSRMAVTRAVMVMTVVVGGGVVEVVLLMACRCVVVVVACAGIVVWVVALRWVAGEYSGSGL